MRIFWATRKAEGPHEATATGPLAATLHTTTATHTGTAAQLHIRPQLRTSMSHGFQQEGSRCLSSPSMSSTSPSMSFESFDDADCHRHHRADDRCLHDPLGSDDAPGASSEPPGRALPVRRPVPFLPSRLQKTEMVLSDGPRCSSLSRCSHSKSS